MMHELNTGMHSCMDLVLTCSCYYLLRIVRKRRDETEEGDTVRGKFLRRGIIIKQGISIKKGIKISQVKRDLYCCCYYCSQQQKLGIMEKGEREAGLLEYEEKKGVMIMKVGEEKQDEKRTLSCVYVLRTNVSTKNECVLRLVWRGKGSLALLKCIEGKSLSFCEFLILPLLSYWHDLIKFFSCLLGIQKLMY